MGVLAVSERKCIDLDQKWWAVGEKGCIYFAGVKIQNDEYCRSASSRLSRHSRRPTGILASERSFMRTRSSDVWALPLESEALCADSLGRREPASQLWQQSSSKLGEPHTRAPPESLNS